MYYYIFQFTFLYFIDYFLNLIYSIHSILYFVFHSLNDLFHICYFILTLRLGGELVILSYSNGF